MNPSSPPTDLTTYAPGAYSIHFGVDVTPRIRLLNKDRAGYIRSGLSAGKDEATNDVNHLAKIHLGTNRLEAKVNHLSPDKCQVIVGDWTLSGWVEWANTGTPLGPWAGKKS